MCGDEDGRNSYAVAYQVLLKLHSIHLGHLKIDDQAFGKTINQRREKLLARPVSFDTKITRTQ
jgi:hypothetical protein